MVERYKPVSVEQTTTTKIVIGRPWQKGQRVPGSGRKPGQQNKITVQMCEAMDAAIVDVGELKPIYAKKKNKETGRMVNTSLILGFKPTGKGGMRGYFRSMHIYNPHLMMMLWRQRLPSQLKISADVTKTETVTTRFETVDPATMTIDQLQAALQEAIALTKPPPALPKPNDFGKMIEGTATEVPADDEEEAA